MLLARSALECGPALRDGFQIADRAGPGLAPALANPAWRDWPYDSTPRVARH